MNQKTTRQKAAIAISILTLLCGCQGEFQTSAKQIRAANAAYDSNKIQLSLSDIETWHISNKTGVAESLRDGVPVPSIEMVFLEEDCQPNDELKALWSWRNGESSSAAFVWYHDFLSVEEARSQYQWLLINPLIKWDPNYIPVFTFEGEWYAVYCGPNKGKAGPIVHFYLEDGARISYTSLTSYLVSMAEALNSGAVTWRNGAMVEDIGRIFRIHQKHNSNIMFPYHVPQDT